MSSRDGEVINILLVEDNPGDVRLTREILRAGKVDQELHVVGDGEQAIAFLRREGGYENLPSPDLILLDLKLPRKDGLEVLAELRADPELRTTPVAVLTSSPAESDLVRSRDLGAVAFMTKPLQVCDLVDVVTSVEDIWVRFVRGSLR